MTTAALLSLPFSVEILHSQTPGARAYPSQRALVLQGGEWHRDLEGTIGVARVELPLAGGGRWLLVPGLTYSHYTFGSPTEIDVLVPEALIQLQLSRGGVRPYVGIGAGLSLINVIHTFDPVFTLDTGLRIDVTPEWGARVAGEVRSFGFEAGTIGWSLGIARRF